ncbi:hypothetical protein B0H14DRAFT_3619895 [Mycena olivaceomarginata]|nr:hypothetical protein B0H14DRAFT_3619895 [Mycena olivaceomarginata]
MAIMSVLHSTAERRFPGSIPVYRYPNRNQTSSCIDQLLKRLPPPEDKSLFADIFSVLAMTYYDIQPRGTLVTVFCPRVFGQQGHRLLTPTNIGGRADANGPAPETGEEETPQSPAIGTIEDRRAPENECAVFTIGHYAELDAVDLLDELEIVDEIALLGGQHVCTGKPKEKLKRSS